MYNRHRLAAVLTLAACFDSSHAARLDEQPTGPQGAVSSTKPTNVVGGLVREAEKLRFLVKTDAVRSLLDAVPELPEPTPRTVYRSKDKLTGLSQSEYDRLGDDEKEDFQARPCEPMFYYYTGYGSPLIYSRPLDVIAETAGWSAADAFAGKRILDFGYGLIGHLRLLAMRGADVTGTEVSPILRALYSEPGDTGEIAPAKGTADHGHLRALNGFWPGDADLSAMVGDGYDLFIAKNVLKRGYIHPDPTREVDKKYLIDLGVDDERFLSELHRILKPGGYALIYNISPAQNTPESGKPYLPHADGRCAFTREAVEKAGFEVLEFDKDDTSAALDIWMALGIDQGKGRDEMAKDLFAWYTVMRRKWVKG